MGINFGIVNGPHGMATTIVSGESSFSFREINYLVLVV